MTRSFVLKALEILRWKKEAERIPQASEKDPLTTIKAF